MRRIQLALLLSTVSWASAGCNYEPGVNNELPPKGVIEGQIIYTGPPPCTENGHVVGHVVLFVYNKNGLPPPEGFSGPANVGVVAGDVMFPPHMRFGNGDGKKRRPPPDAAPITVSADYVVAPMDAGEYQIRALFDHDGDFRPQFGFSSFATADDIAGGALLDPSTFDPYLPGPKYATIRIGEPDRSGKLQMPADGVDLKGVTVQLVKRYGIQQPYVYFDVPTDEVYGNVDPDAVQMPSDYWMPSASLISVEKGVYRVKYGSGIREAEEGIKAPFFLHTSPTPPLKTWWYDSNGDGIAGDPNDLIAIGYAASMMPQVLWLKLDAKDSTKKALQSNPNVIIQGITLYKDGLMSTVAGPSIPKAPTDMDHFTVGAPPFGICVKNGFVTFVTPHRQDKAGKNFILSFGSDEAKNGEAEQNMRATLSKTFGAPLENVAIEYGCLPHGEYQTMVVYTTGQMWTVPNETGICMADEMTTKDKEGNTTCSGRKALASQSRTFTVVEPPKDDAERWQYCVDHPVPRGCQP